ncbi:hypothetical protein ACU5AY_03740 [Rhizobium sp. PAMB 3174]
MKHIIAMALLGLGLSGCARTASVDLENAIVSNGNINSRRVAFGDVLLWDRQSGTVNYLRNLLDEQVPKDGKLLGVNTIRTGNYTASSSRDLKITFSGDFSKIKASAEAEIASSLRFEMKDTRQKRFAYPNDVLNAAQVAAFRADVANYDSDRYRFLFVYEIYSGQAITYSFNGAENDGGRFTLDVAGKKVEVKFKNGGSVQCEGEDNACIVATQIWRLKPNPDGATGYKFVLDTAQSAQVIFRDKL